MNGIKVFVSATARPDTTRHQELIIKATDRTDEECRVQHTFRRARHGCTEHHRPALAANLGSVMMAVSKCCQCYRYLCSCVVEFAISGRGFLGLSQNGVSAHEV